MHEPRMGCGRFVHTADVLARNGLTHGPAAPTGRQPPSSEPCPAERTGSPSTRDRLRRPGSRRHKGGCRAPATQASDTARAPLYGLTGLI